MAPPAIALLAVYGRYLGASVASAAWFAALGFGARLVAPHFARPAAWRVLDVAIGVVMLLLAAGLVGYALR